MMLTKDNVEIAMDVSLLKDIEQYLNELNPKPCLIHGDLWRGNLGFTKSNPVIYDPAIHIGDRETDIAMTYLFGGFAQDFYQSYHEHFPLEASAKKRITLYQLYPILNHAFMFGGDYISQSKDAIAKIRQQLN
jgi:fructosamine-3-kinase